MNRDNMIKELENFIETRQSISTNIIIEASKLYLKLLQLPQRTINDLEVGDYVELETMCYLVTDHSYPETVKGLVDNIEKDWFEVSDYELNHGDVMKIKIIPHQALTLLKEVLGNE